MRRSPRRCALRDWLARTAWLLGLGLLLSQGQVQQAAAAEPTPLTLMREAAEAQAEIDPARVLREGAHGAAAPVRRPEQLLRDVLRTEVAIEVSLANQSNLPVVPHGVVGTTAAHGQSAQAREAAAQAQGARRGAVVGNAGGNGRGHGGGGDHRDKTVPPGNSVKTQSQALTAPGSAMTGGGRQR